MSKFSFASQHPVAAVARMLYKLEEHVLANDRWGRRKEDDENLAYLVGVMDMLMRANLSEAVVERFAQQVQAASVEIALLREEGEEAEPDV